VGGVGAGQDIERSRTLDMFPMKWVVGQKNAREEGQGEQENFRVFATEMANSVDFIRPYLEGGPP
jgi:hypothetical protein